MNHEHEGEFKNAEIFKLQLNQEVFSFFNLQNFSTTANPLIKTYQLLQLNRNE